jgi:hypothetical protein
MLRGVVGRDATSSVLQIQARNSQVESRRRDDSHFLVAAQILEAALDPLVDVTTDPLSFSLVLKSAHRKENVDGGAAKPRTGSVRCTATPRRLACANGPGARHPRRALELTGVLTAGVMCASRQECRSRPSVSDPSATVDACKANNCGSGGGSETRRRPGRRRCAPATSSTFCCLAVSPRCSAGRCAWRAKRAGDRFRAASACEEGQALR